MEQLPPFIRILVPALLLAGLLRVILKSIVALPW